MKLLFVVEPKFFLGHLNGVRIPLLLRMLQALASGQIVHVALGPDRKELTIPGTLEHMDAAHRAAVLTSVAGPAVYDLAVFQKGQADPLQDRVTYRQKALMLNDARSRQAANQFYELLSGRFGADLYRLSAPLRVLLGMLQDRKQMHIFDIVYVQTAPEANFLRRIAPHGTARIEIMNNARLTRELFPGMIRPRGSEPRARDFVLPVPPGIRREREYTWFLRRLAAHPDLCARTTVLAGRSFSCHIPRGMAHDSEVPDFHVYLRGFNCVLIPTKHYTGLNNRVFQSVAAGCDVIASPEALEGLIPESAALAVAPRSFAAFREAMRGYPDTALSAETVLS